MSKVFPAEIESACHVFPTEIQSNVIGKVLRFFGGRLLAIFHLQCLQWIVKCSNQEL